VLLSRDIAIRSTIDRDEEMSRNSRECLAPVASWILSLAGWSGAVVLARDVPLYLLVGRTMTKRVCYLS
jgi:hypothetical protein